ncbi:MAG: hypothetical protein Q8O43_04325 [Dehalococcoidia bacterium]|nr:hypothetical protein [Dehalococcoidia bacterium]
MKVITCPHCGKVAATLGIGRAATNIVVTDICDALRLCRSVPLAAEKLGCSRGLVYKILKANGLTVAGVINGLATKDTTLLQNGGLNDGR